MSRRTIWFLCTVYFLSAHFLSALTVRMLTDEALVRTADVILTGRVLSAYSDIDPEDGHIYTHISVYVTEYLKGKNRLRTVILKTPGGIVGNIGMSVEGAADFYRNEEVMLFLSHSSDNSLFPVGLFLGKLSIYRDADTGRTILIRSADGKGEFFFTPRSEVLEGLAPEQKVFFDSFRAKVQTVLQGR